MPKAKNASEHQTGPYLVSLSIVPHHPTAPNGHLVTNYEIQVESIAEDGSLLHDWSVRPQVGRRGGSIAVVAEIDPDAASYLVTVIPLSTTDGAVGLPSMARLTPTDFMRLGEHPKDLAFPWVKTVALPSPVRLQVALAENV